MRRRFLSPADNPLGGTGGLEPLDDALRRLRRRADLASVAILGVIVGIITPLWIAEPPPMTWYAAANLSIFFFLPPAILFVLGRWRLRRMRSQYARIRPAIRDVGIGFLRGVVIVLHNGLFVQSMAPAHIASLFFTSGGARMQPTVAEALRWTGPMRWKRDDNHRLAEVGGLLMLGSGPHGVRRSPRQRVRRAVLLPCIWAQPARLDGHRHARPDAANATPDRAPRRGFGGDRWFPGGPCVGPSGPGRRFVKPRIQAFPRRARA